MNINLDLGIPPGIDENEILLDIGDRRDANDLLCQFGEKAKMIIPDLALLDFGISIDVSDVLAEERFGHNGYIRMEVEWLDKAKAKISILQFAGMQITDEEAVKIYAKIIPQEKIEFQRNEKGDPILFLDIEFKNIRLSGYASDCVRFVKRNKIKSGENDVLVRMEDWHNNGKCIYHVYISDLNGTLDGRKLAEHFADLGPDYAVQYYNLIYGDAKWRKIKEKKIRKKIAKLFSLFS